MLTARDQLADITKASDLGIEGFIVKPFDYRIMLAKIKETLGT